MPKKGTSSTRSRSLSSTVPSRTVVATTSATKMVRAGGTREPLGQQQLVGRLDAQATSGELRDGLLELRIPVEGTDAPHEKTIEVA